MALVLSAVRTGFGAFGGALSRLTATDLAVAAGRQALERSRIPGEAIGHVVVGNVVPTSADSAYMARHTGLRAGLPESTPAVTVNRLCGSGFETVIQGARLIEVGEAQAVLAGGAEAMSLAPHVIRGARFGLRLGAPPPLEDMLWSALTDSHCGLPMAETAERLGAQYGLTRAEVDTVALRSQERARDAWAAGAFQDEVVPVMLRGSAGDERPWARDEHMRPDSTAEGLAKLPPLFRPNGLVTAGNASGIVDGAAMVVLASEATARAHGALPLGRVVASAVVGVDPTIMGIGPVPASREALRRAGLTLKDMDLVEINEAFAAQYLAVERELDLDPARTNVHGGAVALGHPLAATGTRLIAHLLHALRRSGGRYGLGAACIGGGQGIAMILEAFAPS